MTDRATEQQENLVAPEDSEAVPVLITFALLFLLSAAVWFVLDRIRISEVESQVSQSTQQGTIAPATAVQPSKVATAK